MKAHLGEGARPTLYATVSLIPQLSKEEEELSSQMSSFNEAMTRIRELEERAVEELKSITQVGASPSQGQTGPPLPSPQHA